MDERTEWLTQFFRLQESGWTWPGVKPSDRNRGSAHERIIIVESREGGVVDAVGIRGGERLSLFLLTFGFAGDRDKSCWSRWCLCSTLVGTFLSFLFSAFVISNFGFGAIYEKQMEKSIMSSEISIEELLNNRKSGDTTTRHGNGSIGANGDGHQNRHWMDSGRGMNWSNAKSL